MPFSRATKGGDIGAVKVFSNKFSGIRFTHQSVGVATENTLAFGVGGEDEI